MKGLRAVSRVSDSVLAHRIPSRSSRQLSTALQRAAPLSSSSTSIPRIAHRPQQTQPSSQTQRIRYNSSTTPDVSLQKTPLYDLHIANGGKMVPFGGFHMPVQYSSLSVSESHHFTRSHASLF